jgi:hypothetical protein
MLRIGRGPMMARRRRRLLVGLAAVLGLLGLDYAAGLLSDEVALALNDVEVERATVTSCGGVVTPLGPRWFDKTIWRGTPARLCPGPTTIQATLADGTVRRCTGFAVVPGRDWQVTVGAKGCSGFDPVTLPLLP